MILLDPSQTREVFGYGGGSIDTEDGALIPEMGVSGTPYEIEEKNKAGTISVYEVRKGDTLSAIAEMFSVTVNTIRWANELDGPIKPGDKLVILPVAGLKYVVKKGDTLASLAKKFEADSLEIARFNGLNTDSQLAIGSEIIIPNAEMPASATYASGKPASIDGYFINPVPGGIITQGVHGYNGIDIGAPTGSSVIAAASGKVILSREGGWNGGYGSYIIVSHKNGTQTLYSHLNKNFVSVGDYVDKGQAIGSVGSTGRSTGPHLHFEVRGAKNPLSACRVGSRCNL